MAGASSDQFRRSPKRVTSRADAAPTGLLNEAIWKSVKGRNSTMPAPRSAGR